MSTPYWYTQTRPPHVGLPRSVDSANLGSWTPLARSEVRALSERNRRELERKFPDQPETDPEWLKPREPLALTDEQVARLHSVALTPEEFARIKKKAPSGKSARRREYVRPDPSDTLAYAEWAASTPPTNVSRVAEELVRWYGAVCHLCDEAIDMNLRGHHPGRWNVDHVTPRSRGGAQVWGNLMLAHRGCNTEKGDLALPEPPAWLYAQLRRAAIERFEDFGLPERNVLERARYDAVVTIANLGIMKSNFEYTREQGLDVSGFRIPQQAKRAEQAIAKVQRIQDRVVAKHDAKVTH
jgi:5-methylcytosine-specific restriction endonuclease McrA